MVRHLQLGIGSNCHWQQLLQLRTLGSSSRLPQLLILLSELWRLARSQRALHLQRQAAKGSWEQR